MARGPGKGNTNNPKGKPKGTPNRVTKEARENLNLIIEGEIDHIKESLNVIRKDDHFKYLSVLEKFMSYIIPKKRDITSDDQSIVPSVTIIEDRTKPKAD